MIVAWTLPQYRDYNALENPKYSRCYEFCLNVYSAVLDLSQYKKYFKENLSNKARLRINNDL